MSMTNYRDTRGFILLPILTALALLGLFAYMLNRSGGLETKIADSLATEIQARYIAEAGMRHAKWFLSSDCSFRAALTTIPFGAGHTYGVTMKDNSDGTIHLVATGVLHGQNADATTHYSETMVDDYRCVPLTPKALYWTDWGDQVIRRAELDGSGINTLLTSINGLLLPKPLAIDQDKRKIYWGDGNLIYRADVDGSLMEQIIDCLDCDVSGLDLDPANNALYYTDRNNKLVAKSNLDGTNKAVLIATFISNPSSLRVDLSNGRFYFADQGNQTIISAKLDGSDQQTLIAGVQATALALDSTTKSMYYFNHNSRNIDRINYDGTNLTTVVTVGGGAEINGLDLDLDNNFAYWTRTDNRRVQRASMDGTGLKDLVGSDSTSTPWEIRLGPAKPLLVPRTKGPYWTEDQGGNKKVLRRAELDGSNLQTLVSAQKAALNLKFDLPSDQLFWAGDKTITSSTAKGARLTVILNCAASGTCASVYGLALDPVDRYIYWVDQVNKAIYRIGYGGTNQTLLVGAGLNKPWDIDLDLTRGKMYWVDEGTRSLKNANLDGSNVQIVLSDTGGAPVRQPYAIAVDGHNSFLYWFDNFTRTIYRSTLTGGAVTPLIGPTNVDEARALTLDLEAGKIYWSERAKKTIKRANLDGSSPEVVIDLTVESNKPPWGVTIVPGTL